MPDKCDSKLNQILTIDGTCKNCDAGSKPNATGRFCIKDTDQIKDEDIKSIIPNCGENEIQGPQGCIPKVP